MARIAGFRLADKWAGWGKSPFTSDSTSRLEAQRVQMTAALDSRRIWQAQGARSAAVYLAGRVNVAPFDLRRDVTLGRRLRAMPATWDAFASGAIMRRHAEVLAGAQASPRPPIADKFPEHEQMLVGLARDLDYASFDAAFRYWQERTDPDGAADDADTDFESRHLNLSQGWRQRWVLKGELDPVAGAEVAEALQRIYDELWHDDWKLCRDQHGDDACEDPTNATPTHPSSTPECHPGPVWAIGPRCRGGYGAGIDGTARRRVARREFPQTVDADGIAGDVATNGTLLATTAAPTADGQGTLALLHLAVDTAR